MAIMEASDAFLRKSRRVDSGNSFLLFMNYVLDSNQR